MCLAVPALVTDLLPDAMARVDVGGIGKTISVAMVDDVAVGDYVILHVGHALARLDPEEAQKTLALIQDAIDFGGVHDDKAPPP